MARDATSLTSAVPNREASLNYPPAFVQQFVDNFIGPVHLKFPIAFGTADAAVLYTIPTGYKLEIHRAYWEVTADFTGGASSAIGVSSANTNYSTKGDILGSAAGNLAAALTAAAKYTGTPGTKMVTGTGVGAIVVLNAADTLRFDRIVSAFTAGTGFVHVTGVLVID